jgi:hypothetical protein
LTEAQKLTQSTKIPGVFEEDIKRNNPLDRIAVSQAANSGLKIEWLQEKSTSVTDLEAAASETDIGDQLSWTDDVEYTERESTLRRIVVQRKLDNYNAMIYSTYNNYEKIVLMEMEKALKRKCGDRIIYGDTTYGGSPTQFDGFHSLAAERGTAYTAGSAYNKLNIDGGEAGLSLYLLRVLINAMKYGVDEILLPSEIGIWLDAAYQEKGFAGLATATAGNLTFLTQGWTEIGKPMLFFMGIPLVRTDFLLAEQQNTGTGASSNARAKWSSGDKGYSLFAVKYGDVMAKQPGICFAYGGTEGAGDLYALDYFDKLEDYDAKGMRMKTYGSVLLGTTLALGRIWDMEDVAITV